MKSATSYGSPQEAQQFRAELLERSDHTGNGITVTILNRDTGQILPMPPLCQFCQRFATRETGGEDAGLVCAEHYMEFLENQN